MPGSPTLNIFLWCTNNFSILNILQQTLTSTHLHSTTAEPPFKRQGRRRENGKNVGRIAFSMNMQRGLPLPPLPFFCVTLGSSPRKNTLRFKSTYIFIFMFASQCAMHIFAKYEILPIFCLLLRFHLLLLCSSK